MSGEKYEINCYQNVIQVRIYLNQMRIFLDLTLHFYIILVSLNSETDYVCLTLFGGRNLVCAREVRSF